MLVSIVKDFFDIVVSIVLRLGLKCDGILEDMFGGVVGCVGRRGRVGLVFARFGLVRCIFIRRCGRRVGWILGWL